MHGYGSLFVCRCCVVAHSIAVILIAKGAKTLTDIIKWLKKYPVKTLLATVAIVLIGLMVVLSITQEEYSVSKNEPQASPGSETQKNVTEQPSPSQAISNQSTSPSSPSSSNTSPQPYVAPVCTKTVVPYTTTFIEAPDLYPSDSYSNGGRDGEIITCTADSLGNKPKDITYSPYNKRTYVGTKSDSTPTYTYQQAMQAAQSQCSPIAQASGTGSSAYQVCIETVLNNYGY